MCFGGFASCMTSPSSAVVRKIRSPQTIGEEWPRPGMAVFHFTFCVGVHTVGRPVSGEMPWLSGPRHCDQFAAGFGGVAVRGLVNRAGNHSAAPKKALNDKATANVHLFILPFDLLCVEARSLS